MKKIYLVAILLTVGQLAQAQKAWNFIGDFRNLYGIYNQQTFAYEQPTRQYNLTTDGGTTTTPLGFAPVSGQTILKVHYIDQADLVLATREGSSSKQVLKIYMSSDAGATFTYRGEVLDSIFNANSINRLYFFNTNEGLCETKTTYKGDVVTVLSRTTDGGVTWNLALADTFAIEDGTLDANFFRNGRAEIYPVGGSALITTDRGATWTTSQNPLFVSASMASDGTSKRWGVGWAGSQNPCSVVSVDGGSTYTPWSLPDFATDTAVGISQCSVESLTPEVVEFVAPNSLLVHGYQGSRQKDITILSEDGGSTWEEVTIPQPSDIDIITLADDGTTFINIGGPTWAFGGGSAPVGLNETVKIEIGIFPNPAQNELYFSEPISGTVKIYNLSGAMLKQFNADNTKVLQIADLPHGLYILRTTKGTAKFVKE